MLTLEKNNTWKQRIKISLNYWIYEIEPCRDSSSNDVQNDVYFPFVKSKSDFLVGNDCFLSVQRKLPDDNVRNINQSQIHQLCCKLYISCWNTAAPQNCAKNGKMSSSKHIVWSKELMKWCKQAKNPSHSKKVSYVHSINAVSLVWSDLFDEFPSHEKASNV